MFISEPSSLVGPDLKGPWLMELRHDGIKMHGPQASMRGPAEKFTGNVQFDPPISIAGLRPGSAAFWLHSSACSTWHPATPAAILILTPELG